MIRLLVLMVAASVPAQDAPYDMPMPPKCDLEKVERGFFCETCYKVLDKEDITRKGEHKDCSKPVQKAEICVKEIFACPACRGTWPSAGTCKTPACAKKKVELVRTLSRCRVVYRCPGTCKQMSRKPGSCKTKGCNKKGQKFQKTCELSGTPPHAPKR